MHKRSSWVEPSALRKPVVAVNVCHLGTGNVPIRPGVQLRRKLPDEFEASPRQTGPWLRKKVGVGGGWREKVKKERKKNKTRRRRKITMTSPSVQFDLAVGTLPLNKL